MLLFIQRVSFTIKDRVWKRDYRDTPALQADPLYTQCLSLPQDMIENPANCVTTKFMRAALNKDPRPIFCVHVIYLKKKTLKSGDTHFLIYNKIPRFSVRPKRT